MGQVSITRSSWTLSPVRCTTHLARECSEDCIPDSVGAERLHFVGSPAVRVNGRDIDPAAPTQKFNLKNRLNWLNVKPVGRTPREWITEALRKE